MQFFARFNLRVHYVSGSQSQRENAYSRKPEYQDGEPIPSPMYRHILKLEQLQLVARSVIKVSEFKLKTREDAFVKGK